MVVGHKVYHGFIDLKELLIQSIKVWLSVRILPADVADAPVNPWKLGGGVKHLASVC